MRPLLIKGVPPQEPLKDGVIFFSWRDAAIVFFISTIHTGKGFILRLRQRIRDLTTPLPGARRLFQFSQDRDLMDQETAQSFLVH
jgi:hypothetical protein